MDERWAKHLWESQKRISYRIEGRDVYRIRWGKEGRGWLSTAGKACDDCGARPGQFHGCGCDLERCPACGGQVISCGCVEEPFHPDGHPCAPES